MDLERLKEIEGLVDLLVKKHQIKNELDGVSNKSQILISSEVVRELIEEVKRLEFEVNKAYGRC